MGYRRIAIVDDHNLFSDALKLHLEKEDISLKIATYNNLKSFERDLRNGIIYDFILLDIQLKEENGLVFLEKNKSSLLKDCNVVIVSSSGSVPIIKYAISIGANAFVSKNCEIEELMLAFEIIEKGKIYISDALKNDFADAAINHTAKLPKLTSRETEILSYLCASYTVKEIAGHLELSPNTIQMYVKNLFRKLNQNRTTDLVLFAVKNGLNNPV